MKKGQRLPVDSVCTVEYGTRVVQKRDGGTIYPVYGGGGATFKVDNFNRENRLVVARFGMSEECTRFVEGKFFLNDSGLTVSPKSARVSQRFLDYHLLALNDEIYALGKGTAQKNLDVSLFRLINLFVPDTLAEQQRIVALLDEAFAGLATAQANAAQNLQNARALFESHLQAVFTQRGEGWVQKKVSDIAKHSLGKMLDRAKNKGEPKPYLRNLNVRWFTFDLSDVSEMRFLPEEEEKYTAVKGDVLICEGGYPGRAAIWEDDRPVYFQKALHRVRFTELEQNKWFVYYLYAQDQSGNLKKHFNGVGIQHFTGEGLAKFEVPLPPLRQMRDAVAKFDALSAETQRLTRIYEQKQSLLAELKKSLLHQAFTGML